MPRKARYLKIVECGDEDGCLAGGAPPLIGQCRHGHEEAKPYAKLRRIVEEWVDILETDGRELPEPLGREEIQRQICSGRCSRVAPPSRGQSACSWRKPQ